MSLKPYYLTTNDGLRAVVTEQQAEEALVAAAERNAEALVLGEDGSICGESGDYPEPGFWYFEPDGQPLADYADRWAL